MNTKSIIASLALVLGIGAPAAMAAPAHRDVDLTRRDQVTVIDRTTHREPGRTIVVHEGDRGRDWNRAPARPVIVQPPVIRSYWVQLAANFQLNSDGRQSISNFGPTTAREITLSANGCAMPISQLVIEYQDGTYQVERDLNFTVANGRPLTLGTNAYKQIKRVVVYGPQGARLDGYLTLSALV